MKLNYHCFSNFTHCWCQTISQTNAHLIFLKNFKITKSSESWCFPPKKIIVSNGVILAQVEDAADIYHIIHYSAMTWGSWHLTSLATGLFFSRDCSGWHSGVTSLDFLRGMHWEPVDLPNKSPIIGKAFPCEVSSCTSIIYETLQKFLSSAVRGVSIKWYRITWKMIIIRIRILLCWYATHHIKPYWIDFIDRIMGCFYFCVLFILWTQSIMAMTMPMTIKKYIYCWSCTEKHILKCSICH